jgi:hypothetical protein
MNQQTEDRQIPFYPDAVAELSGPASCGSLWLQNVTVMLPAALFDYRNVTFCGCQVWGHPPFVRGPVDKRLARAEPGPWWADVFIPAPADSTGPTCLGC